MKLRLWAAAAALMGSLTVTGCSQSAELLPAAPIMSAEALAAADARSYATPPRNPFAADSPYAIPHGDSAQSDMTTVAGPVDVSRALLPEEIRSTFVGPGAIIGYLSGRYPDGRRILWVNAVNGVFKLDAESYEILQHIPSPHAQTYTREWADAAIASFNADNGGAALRKAGEVMMALSDLSGVYIVIGANNWLYVGGKDGSITAYGDEVENDPASPIVVKARFSPPDELQGPMVGMNVTYDGWLVMTSEQGQIVAVSMDLTQHRLARLRHSDTEDVSAPSPGMGWIRNSLAIDDSGGIYIASRNHMHKVVWTGDRLSTDETDGAWSEPYRNGGGSGSGSTPTLMGFGPNEDHLVVITDGDERMNLTVFWRDGIPDDWEQLPNAPSRRIAGIAPATMGNPELTAVQSEQSVAVAGYGAFVVNNTPRNPPMVLPAAHRIGLLSGPLGSNPEFQPFGVQRFQWDPQTRTLYTAWENAEVSSPNCVPWISTGSNQVYFIGARDNQWTLESVDWTTGRSTFHWTIGDQAYNSSFAPVVVDDLGRIFYGTTFGRVRIEPRATAGAN
ncbi:MAG: hypothetical protein NW206_16570 [Hyphomonadaceae bacterium]|nr:hypothetical protein [Hyphomonadaceae bacterium]